MCPLPARGPAALSRPAPIKCHRGPGSCSGGAQPPRPMQTWPCSTTSLRGLQQQPSPITRGVGDIKAQEQREQLASEWHLWSSNAIIWKSIIKKKKQPAEERQAAPLHFPSGLSKEKPLEQPQPLPARPGRRALGRAEPSAGCSQQAAREGGRQTSTPQLNYSDRLHCRIKH